VSRRRSVAEQAAPPLAQHDPDTKVREITWEVCQFKRRPSSATDSVDSMASSSTPISNGRSTLKAPVVARSNTRKLSMRQSQLIEAPICIDQTEDKKNSWISYVPTEISARFVAHPDSWLRFAWDLLSFAMVTHDVVMVPLLVLSIPQTWVITIMAWGSRFFWSFDCIISFLTGFPLHDGTVEDRIPKIAAHYLWHGFSLDISLVCVSWLQLGKGRALEWLQWLRMLRVLRFARLQVLMDAFFDRTQTDVLSVLIGSLEIMFVILAVIHIMTCLWIGVGSGRSDGWVARIGIGEDDTFQQYLVSFTWALANFHGQVDIFAETRPEQAFTVGTMLAGFVIAAAFVAVLSNSATRLYAYTVANEDSARLKVLSKYLHDHGISTALSRRVKSAIKEAMSDLKMSTKERDVELLQFLSEPLRAELHFERHGPVILKHPLFKRLCEEHPASVRQLCHTAISTMRLGRDDVLFHQSEVPSTPSLVFVCHGELSYKQYGAKCRTVGPGGWLCEHLLWTNLAYQGTLVALSRCRLLMVDAVKFHEIASCKQWESVDLKHYAHEFINCVVKSEANASDIGDRSLCNRFLFDACPEATPRNISSRGLY